MFFLRTRGDLIFQRGHAVEPGSGDVEVGGARLQRSHFMPVGSKLAGGDQRNCVKCARIVMRRAI